MAGGTGQGQGPGDDDTGKDQWRRITETVTPLPGRTSPLPPTPAEPRSRAEPPPRPRPTPDKRPLPSSAGVPAMAQPPAAPSRRTLDGHWDRVLGEGRIEPDMVIDLHGYTVAGAHAQLARKLDEAISLHMRVLLVIAGKRRRPDEAPRGAIRRELEHWLAHGCHAASVAAVRSASPRHGGAGAVYVILRRPERVR